VPLYAALWIFSIAAAGAPQAVWLEKLDVSKMSCGYGVATAGKTIQDGPLTLKGAVYTHGIGTHADSEWLLDLNRGALQFSATVGVDDETAGGGSVTFEVWCDGHKAADSGVLRGGDAPKKIEADVRGVRHLVLIVTSANDGNELDHADWADAALVLTPDATGLPAALKPGGEPPIAIAVEQRPEPRINHPRITGATPGRPFLFRIPATGEGPLSFSAANLPPGFILDAATGIITGALESAGAWDVAVTVSNTLGADTRAIRIVGGERQLALTPPMGWNSWYAHSVATDDAMVRQAADWMVKTGLAGHGYQYVNIDDCWQAGRAPDGTILTNRKFPDMRALADYIHARGLKFGIYSSPGPKTCTGYTGSLGHEQQDVDTYCAWGVDYVKYDWCSYSEIATDDAIETLQAPYRLFRNCLDLASRDIVYSLCQYGQGDVWTWGADVGGNLWRTTGDMGTSWNAVAAIGFGQHGRERYAGPGHWNDPDMLVVGAMGWGNNISETTLTPNEKIAYVSLWALLAAPLLISADLARLDAFTLALLTNDEVLAVNQDPLGRQAFRRAANGATEVWAKEMADGRMAVGLFNRGPVAAAVTLRWRDLGLAGRQPLRDLWRQAPVEASEDGYTTQVPGHGTVLLGVGTPRP